VLALLAAVILASASVSYAVYAISLPANFPDKITVSVKEPALQFNGLRIVMFPPIETEPGRSFQFAAATTNGNGPFNGVLIVTTNVTGWTIDPVVLNFAFRMSLRIGLTGSQVLYCPANVCPGAVSNFPFLVDRGINVVYGTVEIGPAAPVVDFEITATLFRA